MWHIPPQEKSNVSVANLFNSIRLRPSFLSNNYRGCYSFPRYIIFKFLVNEIFTCMIPQFRYFFNTLIMGAGAIWIEKVCQKLQTLYQELFTYDNSSIEWWTLCVRIGKLFCCFYVALFSKITYLFWMCIFLL